MIVELGTVSDELADGVLRLLGELGIVASRRIGRVAKSTKDTHWIRVSGADQVERAIELVPERDRLGVLGASRDSSKRIAPTGYRRSTRARPGRGSARRAAPVVPGTVLLAGGPGRPHVCTHRWP